MDNHLQSYYDNINQPWGQLFYKMVWSQIGEIKNMSILDFGSGFGHTANHYAQNNHVVALEPNREMTQNRECTNQYTQIVGDVMALKDITDHSFDIILCHNVLEYTANRNAIIKEFLRLLCDKGVLSIVKHNHTGKIMQKAVFENNLTEALDLLNGGSAHSQNFGQIHYYNEQEFLSLQTDFQLIHKYGIRTFWALQQKNDIKFQPDWQPNMLRLELNACDIEEFKNIAFFHHLLYQKAK